MARYFDSLAPSTPYFSARYVKKENLIWPGKKKNNQSLFKHGKSSVKLKKSLKKCLNTVFHDCRVGIRYVRDSI